MRVADYVGKEAKSKDYGRVFVDSAPPRSKAIVNITVLQRSKGWNDATETYERYKMTATWHPDGQRTLRWGISRRDEYGVKDTVHINTLEL